MGPTSGQQATLGSRVYKVQITNCEPDLGSHPGSSYEPPCLSVLIYKTGNHKTHHLRMLQGLNKLMEHSKQK